jgi:hypothetical protein
MISRLVTCLALSGLHVALGGCASSRGVGEVDQPRPDVDVVTVQVTNRTADGVVLWTQYGDGAPRRLGEVYGSNRTTTLAFEWRDAALKFLCRGSARTRGDQRASNEVTVLPGDRLILIVEPRTLFLHHADDRRSKRA